MLYDASKYFDIFFCFIFMKGLKIYNQIMIYNKIKFLCCRPKADRNKVLRAQVIDSWFEQYRGVVCLISLKDGSLKKGWASVKIIN